MILYYTGTGNSRYAAAVIAHETGDELVCMNDIMRQRISDPYVARYAFESEQPFVFVCPTYCWRMPRIVEQFIRDSRFEGSRRAYFYLTCGSGTGDAESYARELCRETELEFMGLASVKLPENYITMFSAPSYDEAQRILRASLSQIEHVGRQIKHLRPIKDNNSGSPALSRINGPFYRLFVHDRAFRATDKCTGCGLCEQLCPLVNISLSGGKPVWHGNCTQCMACICACPNNAIEYGRRTTKKRRYYLSDRGRQKNSSPVPGEKL